MKDAFWDLAHSALPLLSLLFAMNVVLLIMLVLSMLYITPGSSSYYVGVMSGVVILTSLLGLGYVIRQVRAR